MELRQFVRAVVVEGDSASHKTFASMRPLTNFIDTSLAQLLNSVHVMAADVVRVAALGDLHCTKTSQGAFQSLFARIAESAEVLLIAGDITDYGLPEEALI